MSHGLWVPSCIWLTVFAAYPRITRDQSSAMSLPPHDARNETEIAYWNGAGGRNWVHRQEGQDTILAPISKAAIERAAVQPGERVVDIGCGTGATSIALGERVGLSGHVLAWMFQNQCWRGPWARFRPRS